MRSNLADITGWIAHWGFAVLVAVAMAIGFVAGATVAIPVDIPSAALRSAAVYRVEVGGAIFVALYFVAVAFALALRNRGFTDIGTSGIRAGELSEVPVSLLTQERALGVLFEKVSEIEDLRHERGND